MGKPRIKCPGCGRPLEWDVANRWRPFCSERCKLIDLGAWIKEEHAIPGEPAIDLPDDDQAASAPRRH